MGILHFEKPARKNDPATHAAMNSSDCGVPGTYVPNMRQADMLKWKARKVGGDDPRVEIRKSVCGRLPGDRYDTWSQMLIVVRPDGATVSMNCRAVMSNAVFAELGMAVAEAQDLLARPRERGLDQIREM